MSSSVDPTAPRLVPSLGVGAGAAVLGLLPWLITGMRLPLQNLWDAPTTPEAMPLVLLPFSQYSLTLIAAVILTGSAFAGLAARLGRARGVGALGATLGAVGVQLIALVQAATTVAGGLEEGAASDLYLLGLVAGTAGTIVVGLLLLLLLAKAPPAGAALAIALAAIAAGSWLNAVVSPLIGAGAGLTVFTALQWLPGILAGLGLAWCGVTSVGRVLAWVTSLAALWVGPTLVTAVSAATGSRALARYPLEMLDYASQVFTSALMIPAVSLRTPVTALVVAAVGVALLRAIRARRSR